MLETTTALMIIVLFLVIPMNNYSKFDSNLRKLTFEKKFKSAWNYSLVIAKVKDVNIRFIFDTSHQEIEYYERGIDNLKQHKFIKVPKGMKLSSSRDISIKRDGTIGAPFTIVFRDLDLNKKVEYKMQMEWGEVIESS